MQPIDDLDPSGLEGIAELARKVNKALERGKGIRFEAADLDVLVAAGVYDVIQHAAAKFQREVCQQRARSRSSTPEENTSSAGSATPRASSAPHISKSNGITRPLE